MTGKEKFTHPSEAPKENTLHLLRLFVYGTLKRGHWNHDAFWEGVLDIRDAQIRGRLSEGPGFPLLEVPDEDVFAHGTGRTVGRRGHTGAPVRSGGIISPDRSGQAPQWAPGAPCTGSCSPSTIPNPTCLPSTAWRGSAWAVPASTGACWCPPR